MLQPLKITCVFLLVIAAASTTRAEMHLVIDSLYCKAEVRRAGQDQWTPIAKGAKLYNNDLIRVADSGWARFTWSNGDNSGYINGGSQMLVNTFENPARKRATHHLTIFFGAVFFLIKSTLPQGLFGQEETKVFTPTTVIAIRGTSFDVQVAKDNGRTIVEVLNGTVLLRNIVRNVSSFVSAGYWTAIPMNSDPITPEPIVEKSINNLKTWVPAQIVEREMKAQTEKAKVQHDIIAGSIIADKVIVVPLINSSSYTGPWDLGKGFATLLASGMNKYAQGVSACVKGTGSEDPLILGMQEKARYVLKGAVEDFDIVHRAKITAKADEYLEFNTALVKLRLQLIDVTKNQIIYDNVFFGEATGKHVPANGWPEISKLSFGSDAKFSSSILGQAVSQSIEQSLQDVSKYVQKGK